MSRPARLLRRSRTVVVVVTAVALAAAGLALVSTSHGPDRRAGATVEPGPNVAFWYQPITASTDLTRLGHPRVVVHFSPTNRPEAERLAVDRIHEATGGAAYRYVQLYYLPVRGRLMDLRIGRHREWGFCSSGSTPVYDTSVKVGPDRWMLVDTNERSLVDAFRRYLLLVKSWGWDGIFLDLAHRALTQGVWDQVSTCTHHPVVAGRTSADAYAALVPLARSLGLQVMVNAGPPADPGMPMRPNPRDAACRAGDWDRCSTIDDVARSANWILHEGASDWSDDRFWRNDVQALASDEAYERHHDGARVVALGVYRGPAADAASHIAYQWAVMQLYAVPAAFGTGVDRCGIAATATIDTACNRGGLVPTALEDAALGPPLDPAPLTRSCAGDGWHCVWIRRYRDGMVLVNDTAGALRTGPVAVGDERTCRPVRDLVTGGTVPGGTCARSIDLRLAPFSARIPSYRGAGPSGTGP
jgi:hypothetical protein